LAYARKQLHWEGVLAAIHDGVVEAGLPRV